MSERLDGGSLVALGRTGCLHGEDQPDAAGVILLLARASGIQEVVVLDDQEALRGTGERGGFAAAEIEDFAGILRDALGVLLAVLIADLWMRRHDDAGYGVVDSALKRACGVCA